MKDFYTGSIKEDAKAGAVVTTVKAEDKDSAAVQGPIKYSLGADADGMFVINADTGVITAGNYALFIFIYSSKKKLSLGLKCVAHFLEEVKRSRPLTLPVLCFVLRYQGVCSKGTVDPHTLRDSLIFFKLLLGCLNFHCIHFGSCFYWKP